MNDQQQGRSAMPEQQENQTEVFHLKAPFKPTGDQPQAIEALVQGLKAGDKGQTLLGVTGSGKTFTMANIIAQCNRPTLILEPNKTLASQICTEMRCLFQYRYRWRGCRLPAGNSRNSSQNIPPHHRGKIRASRCRWSGTSSAAAWSSCNMNATI